MKTSLSRWSIALPVALGLLIASASANADVFLTAHAPGMCLGNSAGVADIDYCGNDNKLAFSGYGAVVLNGACLGTDSARPDGPLKWESCRIQANKAASNSCRNEPDQCWAWDRNSGRLNNEQGFSADVENGSRNNGARVIAYRDFAGRSNQKWVFGNLYTVDQYASSAGLNLIGKAQLQAFDRYVSANRATIVAGGGGNIVAGGGGNIVAAGGGNIVAAGGGNIVAAGGGNIVSGGAGNIVSGGAGNVISVAAGNILNLNAATLAKMGGGAQFMSTVSSLIGQDGAGMLPSLASYFSRVSNLVLAADAAKIVAAGGGNIVAGGGGNFNPVDLSSMLRSFTGIERIGESIFLFTPSCVQVRTQSGVVHEVPPAQGRPRAAAAPAPTVWPAEQAQAVQ